MTRSRLLTPLVALLVLLAVTAASVAAVLCTPAAAAAGPPVADVRLVGGLCERSATCMPRLLLHPDGRVTRDGSVVRRVQPAQLRELRRLVATLDLADVRAHPFTGMCPVAYDGQELIVRLRGVPAVLRGCTWDLTRVRAATLAARLVGVRS
jgi:hypothetical protein